MDDPIEALLQDTFVDRLAVEAADRVRRSLVVERLQAGEAVCKRGFLADRWVGVASGAVKVENAGLDGRPTTLATFSAGCWFGEGTVLKHEAWPYSAIATEPSTIATMPEATFRWLLDESLPFARFLIDQLNARLAQFVVRCEHARLHEPRRHVAHCLAELLDHRIHPHTTEHLHLSQEDLARLSGVSRSLVSRVLRQLQVAGLVRHDYRSITVIDSDGLRAYSDH